MFSEVGTTGRHRATPVPQLHALETLSQGVVWEYGRSSLGIGQQRAGVGRGAMQGAASPVPQLHALGTFHRALVGSTGAPALELGSSGQG